MSTRTDDLLKLAVTLRAQGKSEEASSLVQTVSQDLAAYPIEPNESAISVLRSREFLANTLSTFGDQNAADQLFQNIIDEIEKNPSYPETGAASAYKTYAEFLVDTGRSDQAVAFYRRALAIDEHIFGSRTRQSAMDHLGLGVALRVGGQWNAARDELDLARGDSEHVDDPNLIATSFMQLAALANDRNATAEGIVYSEQVAKLLTEAFGQDAPAVLPALCRLGIGYVLAQRADDAGKIAQQVVALSGGPQRRPNWAFVEVTKFKAAIFMSKGDWEGARVLLESVAAFAHQVGNVPLSGTIAYNIANLDLRNRQYSQAIDKFEFANKIIRERFGRRTPLLAYGLLGLSAAYAGIGDNKKASETKSSAIDILRSLNIGIEVPKWL